MLLIIGGKYQGKLDYAKSRRGLSDNDVLDCTSVTEIDFTRKCLYHVEEFVLRCVKNGVSATNCFVSHKDCFANSVIICEDIFCGIVPMDAHLRLWREETGRLTAFLASEAECVVRIFCGLEQVLK